MDKKEINKIARKIVNVMVANGIVVQRYDSYSSNSVYLKFDCGILNTVRISDHKGYDRLHYTYNIIVGDIERGIHCREINGRKQYYYYRASSVDAFIQSILVRKSSEMLKFESKEHYRNRMIQLYKMNKDNKGFWKQAQFYSSKGYGLK